MEITVNEENGAVVDIDENASLEDIVEKLTASEAVMDIAKKVGAASFYSEFGRDGSSFDAKWLRDVARAYFDGGHDAAYSFIVDDRIPSPTEEAYHSYVKDELIKALSPIVEQICEIERFEFADDTIEELLSDGLSDICAEAMDDADTSVLTDMFNRHDKVEIAFGIDLNVLAVDDLHIYHSRGYCVSSEDVDPDANFMRMFKLFNVHPMAFVEYLTTEKGFDPRVPDVQSSEGDEDGYRAKVAREHANRWVAFCEAATTGKVSDQTASALGGVFQGWIRDLELESRNVHDIDRPAAVLVEDIFEMIENASYGGVPVYVARYPIADLLNGKLDEPFVAKGGQIGIHDFINGSGHVITLEGEVLINPRAGGYRASNIDDVYGIVSRYYDNETRKVDGAEWVHCAPDLWRLEPNKEGFYAEITRKQFASGDDGYWLTTHERWGAPTGLYAEAEIFETLDGAKEAGLKTVDEVSSLSLSEPDVPVLGVGR